MSSKYESIKDFKPESFRRLTGVKKPTFDVMVDILTKAESKRRSKGSPKRKLCIADMLLLSLEYLSEYRTVGTNYGLSESQAQRIHRWVEETLIKDNRFHLPGRKKLLESNLGFEIIIVDASERAVDRPKKKSL